MSTILTRSIEHLTAWKDRDNKHLAGQQLGIYFGLDAPQFV